MMKRITYYGLAIIVLLNCGCKKPFAPVIVASNNNYLVVEGVINAGSDSTIFNLSRTVNVNNQNVSNPETGSNIKVESTNGGTYPLTELQPGKYYALNLNLDTSKKYRINIKTSAGGQYVSDYESVLITPPIDSVTYIPVGDQLHINVNAHSANKSVNFYRYTYQETWEFHVMYLSFYSVVNSNLVYRPYNSWVYNCWGNHQSNNITLATTAGLSQAVLSQSVLVRIPSTDEKLESRYSILVNQFAVTKDAYNFWQQLKKNTENLGSIFDSFPSEIPGNIHCLSNPSEPVLGYVGVSTVSSQRIFITNKQLPSSWNQPYPYSCIMDDVDLNSFLRDYPQTLVPIVTGGKHGLLVSTPECTDCTTRGTNVKPSYWPN